MLKYLIIVLSFIFFCENALSATIKCTTPNAVERHLTLPKYTANASMNDLMVVPTVWSDNAFKKIQTYSRVLVQEESVVTCSAGKFSSLSYVELESLRHAPWEYDGYVIYPTSVSGIGVSFNDSSVNKVMKSTSEGFINRGTYTPTGSNTGRHFMHVEIIVWRTPEPLAKPDNDGLLRFGPFRLVHAFQATNASDTFSADSSSVGNATLPRSITLSALNITGGINLTPGTCDMSVKNKVVQMGRQNASLITRGGSPWVDASIVLSCPQAGGYGATTTLTGDSWTNASVGPSNVITAYSAASTKNGTVTIQIVPYTPPSDPTYAEQGIFDLDPGGATGFGIQLAWGRPSSQSHPPARPVPLMSHVAASSVGQNFTDGPYAIGGYALPVGADGTIPLSARYVRTSGEIQGGQANGRVEVIASYN